VLVARWTAAFVLDPDGKHRSQELPDGGAQRMLAAGERVAQPACHALAPERLGAGLSPRLAELHRDAFIIDDGPRSTVDLAAHRGESSCWWSRRPRAVPLPVSALRGSVDVVELDVARIL
jgi:hypothetical protein